MPRTYPKHKKLDALELISYGLPIPVIQTRTGIAPRTLYRWKRQLQQKLQRNMAEKDAPFMAKTSQNRDSCHKTADHCHKTDCHCHKTDHHCHKNLPIDAGMTQNDPAHQARSESAISSDDLSFIRAKLMNVVREITNDLDHSGADINTRSLALSRLLDRIQWLDQLIEQQASQAGAQPESEPVPEAETHDFPGWLRPRAHRSDEQRAAEKAEMARRRAWAKSQVGDYDFPGPAEPA